MALPPTGRFRQRLCRRRPAPVHGQQAGHGHQEPRLGHGRTHRRYRYDCPHGWRQGTDSDIRHLRDAALRSRLRRYVAQLAGLTTDRVLVNMDTKAHPELINTRFAYVSVSRASEDARIYTNDATTLAERPVPTQQSLRCRGRKTEQRNATHQPQPKEQTMTDTKERPPKNKDGISNRNLTILQSRRRSHPVKSTNGIMRRSKMRYQRCLWLRLEAGDRRHPELPARPDWRLAAY